MGLSDGLYVEVNLVCFLVLAIILQKILSGFEKQYENKLFTNTLVLSLIFIFTDMGWVFTGLICPKNLVANYAVNILYFLASGGIGFSWLAFAEIKMGCRLKDNKVRLFLSLIPITVLTILTFSCPVTHAIFYIDENNAYHRGPLHTVQVFCMNIYFIIPCIHAFIKSMDKNDVANKKQYMSICFVIFWAITAQIIQVFIPGYPTISIGIMMAFLNVFIELRDSVISIDQLTQINNRNQMLKFLGTKFKTHSETIVNDIYLLMMDVDYFKSINDTYGHLEGDAALKIVADSLKICAGKFNCFICRYGGDEFIMICENKTQDQISEICQAIKDTVAEQVVLKNKKYKIGVSIGFQRSSEECNTVADLIKSADEQLYIQKSNRRK